MSFSQVSIIEIYIPTAFETYEGWAVVIASVVVLLVLYMSAAGIYQIIKRRMDADDSLLSGSTLIYKPEPKKL